MKKLQASLEQVSFYIADDNPQAAFRAIEIKKPELEALLDELQKSGVNLDDVLFDTLSAHKSKTEKTVQYQRPAGKKSLAQIFAESPFRGLELDFTRSHDTSRPSDL